jgi:hypothetical protein
MMDNPMALTTSWARAARNEDKTGTLCHKEATG